MVVNNLTVVARYKMTTFIIVLCGNRFSGFSLPTRAHTPLSSVRDETRCARDACKRNDHYHYRTDRMLSLACARARLEYRCATLTLTLTLKFTSRMHVLNY